MKLKIKFKGGKGSGHHGHAGTPGSVGGSAPGGGSSSISILDDIVKMSGVGGWKIRDVSSPYPSYVVLNSDDEVTTAFRSIASGLFDSGYVRYGKTGSDATRVPHRGTKEQLYQRGGVFVGFKRWKVGGKPALQVTHIGGMFV